MSSAESPEYSHLWNDLPIAERKRLMPYMLQVHIRHIEQCRQHAVNAHEHYLSDIDAQLKLISADLDKALESK